jgi:hypothetical protein
MLAEIGDCRDRYPTYRALAADAGQHPSPSSQANPATPNSDGRATTACAEHSYLGAFVASYVRTPS